LSDDFPKEKIPDFRNFLETLERGTIGIRLNFQGKSIESSLPVQQAQPVMDWLEHQWNVVAILCGQE
jgi:hypothetical protein